MVIIYQEDQESNFMKPKKAEMLKTVRYTRNLRDI